MQDMNSGYVGYSMSKRASDAYNAGEYPYSKWTKKKILDQVKAYAGAEKAELFAKLKLDNLKRYLLQKSSWHHTSYYANRTEFYAIDINKAQNTSDLDILALAVKEEKKKIEPDNITFTGEIEYLIWTGTKKHPKSECCRLKNVAIKEKGSFYYVYDNNGQLIIRKKIGSSGTRVINYDELAFENKKKEDRERMLKTNSSQQAWDFYEEIKGNCSRSFSNHIYPAGKKPSRYDYEMGLDVFFSIGDKRLFESNDRLILETWSGTEWMEE